MHIGVDGRAISHPQRGGYKSYVTNLVESLADADRENSYTVYLDRRIETGASLQHENFHLRITPPLFPGRWLREQVLLPRRLARDRVTLAHFPTNTAPMICGCRYVVTILDAMRFLDMPQIPRPYSLRSLAEVISVVYMRLFAARAARRAARIITISQCSKRDIVNQLGVPPDRVRVIYPALRSLYQPVDDSRALDACRRTHGLTDTFMLGFGSTAPRKNTRVLLEAFARLGTEVLCDCRLTLVVSPKSALDELRRVVMSLGIGHKVILLTDVRDADLCLLYNAARAFVFPSLYEGFGLPAAEAMACGTPVITGNASSLPEVVGEAGVLVDPSDEIELSRAMSRVLTDHRLRELMAAKGLVRASRFSGRRQALETLAVYREVASV